jgi:2-polyprenyl-6-methoxyphenol hydroxylase-like FAD-dependent oxidoreductase
VRGELCRLLYDATEGRVKYASGTTIEHFEEKGNSLRVWFQNEKMEKFDLLVGADGQGSCTRKLMTGHATETPKASTP